MKKFRFYICLALMIGGLLICFHIKPEDAAEVSSATRSVEESPSGK